MAINSSVGSHFFTFALEHSVKISKFPVLSWYQRTVLSTPLLFSSLLLHDDPNVLIPAANYDPNTQIQRKTKAQLTHCQALLIHFRPLRGITRRLTVIWSPTQDPQSTRESLNTTCHGESPKRDMYSRSLASQPYFSFRWEEREKEKYGWLARLVFAQR